MVKSLIIYLLWLAGGILALKGLVVFLEPRMAFFPIQGIYSTPADLGISFREAAIGTTDGETVHGWLLEHPRPAAEVLFLHGNGGNLSLWLDFLADMQRHSLRVFALDYRGYGKSSGSPTEEGLYRDTEAFVKYFWSELHRPECTVVYWGRSLGGVMAAYAATVKRPQGLILEATFPNKSSLLNHYPALKVLGLFSRYQFPTEDFLRQISCPVMIIHGRKDEVVPFEEGQKLYDRVETEKYFYPVPEAHHNDLHQVGADHYWMAIDQFLRKITHGQNPD